ncbi:hypothetical protein A8990_11714 [Paenibacillus taihuensis]|uniref:DUF1802 family protein n=1 Tax=Paenibacillus taihuensis TaxID=1156355 RepID=A0A3D9RRW2_9BACL|nr:DUF1802 family protein [Paenibacillus taihuensis]REE82650.1 hypothetical protein A8990_11714 [Paenibacillus taihuensis]
MNNGFDQEQPVALKEWAVAVKALTEGKQIIVLRKGGIAEETRDFQLRAPRFYLLPAYEHQRPELLKEPFQDDVRELMAAWQPNATTIEINAVAEAVDDIEIFDQETLRLLEDFHIWTDSFAEERLKWKKTKPLHMLLLRVSKLEQPIVLPMQDHFNGCKSWVNLGNAFEGVEAHPVLSDKEFNERADLIRSKIGR